MSRVRTATALPSGARTLATTSRGALLRSPVRRVHDRVFGLFQRLHTAEEYPGTGMGLAIVKKIVESNGGTVRVESIPGEGSTFFVTLQGEHEA